MGIFFNRRSLSFIALWFILILILASCNDSQPVDPVGKMNREIDEEQSNPAIKNKIKIGFSMDTLEEDRWIKDRDMFKESLEAVGAEVEIMISHEDEALQLEHIETLISHDVDLLVVVPTNAEAAAAIVNKAHLAGIKVISYDRLIKNADVDLYVSFDNEQVGEIQATALTNMVPKGNYVIIGGAGTDNNAHLLKQGNYNVLQPFIERGEITVVYDQWSDDWSPELAYQNMLEALKANNGQVDAVIAANDGTAGGAIRALEEYGLAGEVLVAGQDADIAAIRRIIGGTQELTVYKPIKTLTEKVAEVAFKLAKGETIKTDRKVNNGKYEVPSLLLSPIAVDKSNIDETIIADGFHTWEEVYQTTEE